jgi:hypothetical protein
MNFGLTRSLSVLRCGHRTEPISMNVKLPNLLKTRSRAEICQEKQYCTLTHDYECTTTCKLVLKFSLILGRVLTTSNIQITYISLLYLLLCVSIVLNSINVLSVL